MTPAFSHDEAFQTIERLIHELHRNKRDFVRHGLIAKALLVDELGSKLVKSALRTNQNFTDQKWASNMVAWFSKIFTEQLPASAKRFDRTELGGKYAYKPKDGISLAQEVVGKSVKPLTVFSFGYWGWGSATCQLVQATDAVEKSRGFNPPVFVDIRIRRTGRAVGFKGDGFERLLGDHRHHWMPSLGNLSIIQETGQGIKIKEPEAADELLDIALKAFVENRRVVFFCGCEWPKIDGKVACHRTVVAKLLIRAAKERGVPIEVVEWPGGDPVVIDHKVTPEILAATRRAKMTVDLGKRLPSPNLLGLPWHSVVTLRSGKDRLITTCGPAKHVRNEWCLPVQCLYFDADAELAMIQGEAAQERKELGLNGTAIAKHGGVLT